MEWKDLDSRRCSVARTAEVVGDGWTVLVLRDLFNGVRRFDDLAAHLGIARNVLTRRLAALVDEGIVERVPYRAARGRGSATSTGSPPRAATCARCSSRCWPGATPTARARRAAGAGRAPRVRRAVHVELRCAEGHVVDPRAPLRSVPIGSLSTRAPQTGCCAVVRSCLHRSPARRLCPAGVSAWVGPVHGIGRTKECR